MAGGGGGGGGNSRELDQTPTWAVAVVCAVIVVISILLEKVLHRFGEWLTEKHKKALFEALEKIKAELMILGFISLLLTFGQKYIVKICIPYKVADTMLPCSRKTDTGMEEEADGGHRRRLLTNALADRNVSRGIDCFVEKVPLISTNGLHQLHILIFFLAVFHVASSATAMALGRLKTRGWKHWEGETSSPEYEFVKDPSRFRYTHDLPLLRKQYIINFFRQFFRSVSKADYLALRHGFITVHLAPGSKFNFQKHIKRTLEDDFKTVAGISPALWASALIILLLNVHGWKEKFWASMIPLVVRSSRNEATIITRMAIGIQERHTVVQGIPLVRLSDHRFWFRRPRFVLRLIHSALFQSAFQITYFFWIWYEFDLKSCFHDNFVSIIVNVIIGLLVQFLCSYITLPLYALVSQMGSHTKRSIFDEETSKALIKWHQNAKKKQEKGISRASSVREPSSTMSPRASPVNPTRGVEVLGIRVQFTPLLAVDMLWAITIWKQKLRYQPCQKMVTDQPNKMNSPSQCLLLKREDKSD
ncbi:unnamed protein product, partial [Musa textilis]